MKLFWKSKNLNILSINSKINYLIYLLLCIFIFVCQNSLYQYGRTSFTPKAQAALNSIQLSFHFAAKSSKSQNNNYGGHVNPMDSKRLDSDQDEFASVQGFHYALLDLSEILEIGPQWSVLPRHGILFEAISRRLMAYHSLNSPPSFELFV